MRKQRNVLKRRPLHRTAVEQLAVEAYDEIMQLEADARCAREEMERAFRQGKVALPPKHVTTRGGWFLADTAMAAERLLSELLSKAQDAVNDLSV